MPFWGDQERRRGGGKEVMIVKMVENFPTVNELSESHPQSSICMPSRFRRRDAAEAGCEKGGTAVNTQVGDTEPQRQAGIKPG
jgi:hypothetical protein